MNRYISLLVLLLLFPASLCAKKLSIADVKPLGNSPAEEKFITTDLNGDTCLLLKISGIGPECKLEGAIVDSQFSGDACLANLSRQSVRLTLKSPGYESLQFSLTDFLSKEVLNSSKGVAVEIIREAKPEGISGNYLVLTLNPRPSSTSILINGSEYTTSDGQLIAFLSAGTYTYEINARDCKPASGNFVITDDKVSVIDVDLETEKSKLRVKSDNHEAAVFIDGFRKGRADWEGEVPPGEHLLEVMLPGKKKYSKKFSIKKNELKDIYVPMGPSTVANNTNDPAARGKVNGHEYVDLGLPSGTLWATCNVGANKPSDYGNYYEWGCVSEKEHYPTSENIKSIAGNPLYDAATSEWGQPWTLPTREQGEELESLCSFSNTLRHAVRGCLVTGPNGNSIFIPYAGYFHREYGNYRNEEEYMGGAFQDHFSSAKLSIWLDDKDCSDSRRTFEASPSVRENVFILISYNKKNDRCPIRPVTSKTKLQNLQK